MIHYSPAERKIDPNMCISAIKLWSMLSFNILIHFYIIIFYKMLLSSTLPCVLSVIKLWNMLSFNVILIHFYIIKIINILLIFLKIIHIHFK